MYSHLALANTILERSFATGTPVTPRRLQAILYLVDVEYRELTRTPLNNEPYRCRSTGPILPSLYTKLKPLNGRPITRYLRDAAGHVTVHHNDILDVCLDRIFRPLTLLDDQDVADIVRYPDGAWDHAFQTNSPVLHDGDVDTDAPYRDVLDDKLTELHTKETTHASPVHPLRSPWLR